MRSLPPTDQLRSASSARSDPRSSPDVNGYDVPSGATSSRLTISSVSGRDELTISVASIGPAIDVGAVNGAVVYVSASACSGRSSRSQGFDVLSDAPTAPRLEPAPALNWSAARVHGFASGAQAIESDPAAAV